MNTNKQQVIKQHLLCEANAEDSETAIGNVHGERTLNVTSMTEDETTNSKRTKYVDVASIITETVRGNDAAAHTKFSRGRCSSKSKSPPSEEIPLRDE
ncbi:6826_t:CDS:2 [Funneliformis caledonium]|uniref:6826_t:CDS:1 n=1 Tax=Funneliformis caledonium TaxID=1117310 RepID=A0A9N8ZM24_9GLOM|nr:6826_t:CDS:2 [Funneliformis caledonium]